MSPKNDYTLKQLEKITTQALKRAAISARITAKQTGTLKQFDKIIRMEKALMRKKKKGRL